MVVSSCELPENVFPNPDPNDEVRDCDPACVLDRFIRCGLAGNAQQRAGWKFSGVAPSARVLSFWMVGTDRGCWRDSFHQAIQRQISTRRYRPNRWFRPGIVETGCHATRDCELPNTSSHRNT